MPIKGWEETKSINHHKYFVFDDKIIFKGSANATYAALNNNNEDMTISDDLMEVVRYRKNFISLKRGYFTENSMI